MCQIEVNGANISPKMVEAGAAWAYDEYAKGSLKKQQDKAKANKVGLFAEDNPMQPDVFRYLQKKNGFTYD